MLGTNIEVTSWPRVTHVGRQLCTISILILNVFYFIH